VFLIYRSLRIDSRYKLSWLFPCGLIFHIIKQTQWSRVLLEKLTVTQLVKKFLAFYGTRRFITVFKRIRHWSLSWGSCLQSISLRIPWNNFLIFPCPFSVLRCVHFFQVLFFIHPSFCAFLFVALLSFQWYLFPHLSQTDLLWYSSSMPIAMYYLSLDCLILSLQYSVLLV